MLAVPFENLTIHSGGRNEVGFERNYEKIVVERRGGWCFELNGTFAWLLTQLGFDVTLLGAGVHMGEEGFSDEFDHLTLRVDLAEPWLVDVGFGENFTTPLRLEMGIDQPRDGRIYRLDWEGERIVLSHDGELDYRFGLTPRQIGQFDQNSRFLQSDPGSPFTQQPMCSLTLPDGRLTVSGMRLIETHGGVRDERGLRSADERIAILRERFGITLAAPLA